MADLQVVLKLEPPFANWCGFRITLHWSGNPPPFPGQFMLCKKLHVGTVICRRVLQFTCISCVLVNWAVKTWKSSEEKAGQQEDHGWSWFQSWCDPQTWSPMTDKLGDRLICAVFLWTSFGDLVVHCLVVHSWQQANRQHVRPNSLHKPLIFNLVHQQFPSMTLRPWLLQMSYSSCIQYLVAKMCHASADDTTQLKMAVCDFMPHP